MNTERSFASVYEEVFQNPVTPDRFGDIILIGTSKKNLQSIPSRINRFAQGLARGKVSSKFSHVAICLRPGLWIHAVPGLGISIIETFEIWKYILDRRGLNISIYRPNINNESLYKMVSASQFAFDCYKNPYNLMFFIGKKNFLQKEFYQERFFCSELVMRILIEAKIVEKGKPHRTLPIDIQKLCEESQWSRVDEDEWIDVLKDEQVRRYIFAGGQNIDEQKKNRDDIIKQNLGNPICSTLNTLKFLESTNKLLMSSLDTDAASRLNIFMAEKLRDDLLDINTDNLNKDTQELSDLTEYIKNSDEKRKKHVGEAFRKIKEDREKMEKILSNSE